MAGWGDDTDVIAGDDDDTDVASPGARQRGARVTAPRPVSEPASGSAPGLGSTPSELATYGATGTSPADALRIEEIARTRAFLWVVLAVSAATLAALPLMSGHVLLGRITATLVLLTAAGAVWVMLELREPLRYAQWKVTALALLAASAAYGGVFYWGIFSAAPALIVMGIYFFSRSGNRAAAVLIYAVCAGAQAVLTVLILTGTIADPGLFPAGDRPLHELVVTQGLVQLIFLFTFLTARSTRASTLDAIDKLQQASLQIAQREAQFQEVRAELDAALEGGGPGRYSDRVLGDYRLGMLVGRGAMGEVYDALHMANQTSAAVKILHPHVMDNPQHVQRFLREAQAAGTLQSRHVVRVIRASEPDEALPYLVMERLRGGDLAHHLRKRRRLAAPQVAQLVAQVASVIDAARAHGIVHRDLKPQNLLLSEIDDGEPVWKVLDFGVSKLGESHGTLTQGHVVGTPVYMAPEQARSEDVDYRADLYALAAIAYRCLTGHPPFSGKNVPSILFSVIYELPPAPSELADLPADVDRVLAIGLAKRREDRFDSGEDLALALALALDGQLDNTTRNRAHALESRQPWGDGVHRAHDQSHR